MSNKELAKILYEISDFLEMEEVPFKPRAYERAAGTIESLKENIEDFYNKNGIKGLLELPGIGKSIAKKIEEYIRTGKIKYYETLKKKIPVNMAELTSVEGVGPKTVKDLYQGLKIKNLKDLEKAARSGKISRLQGFTEKTEKNILAGLGFLEKNKGRMILGNALPLAREIEEKLKHFSGVKQAAVAGSIRRRKETVGDFDFIATSSEPKKVMDFFVSLPEVAAVRDKGEAISTVVLNNGMDADLKIVPDKDFGAALHHFTGDKYHNVALRTFAKAKGLKISEYGVFRGKKVLASETEKDVFKSLRLGYIPPEIRTGSGEIELAERGRLPKLIGYGDIRGDLQMHTNWSDGKNTILEMTHAAKKMGYEYIAITDHWRISDFGGTLAPQTIKKYFKEIKEAEKKIPELKILAGTEVDILEDGSLAAPDKYLKEFDIVLAGIHSHFHLSPEKQTARMIRVMENPHVDIIAHPTGRILKRRENINLRLEEVFAEARETGTILEIDAYPDRLDLNYENIRQAIKNKLKLVIDTDSHSVGNLCNMEYGIGEARRGYAGKKDILNTRSFKDFVKCLKY